MELKYLNFHNSRVSKKNRVRGIRLIRESELW